MIDTTSIVASSKIGSSNENVALLTFTIIFMLVLAALIFYGLHSSESETDEEEMDEFSYREMQRQRRAEAAAAAQERAQETDRLNETKLQGRREALRMDLKHALSLLDDEPQLREFLESVIGDDSRLLTEILGAECERFAKSHGAVLREIKRVSAKGTRVPGHRFNAITDQLAHIKYFLQQGRSETLQHARWDLLQHHSAEHGLQGRFDLLEELCDRERFYLRGVLEEILENVKIRPKDNRGRIRQRGVARMA